MDTRVFNGNYCSYMTAMRRTLPVAAGPLEVELHLRLHAGQSASGAALAFSWHFLRIG